VPSLPRALRRSSCLRTTRRPDRLFVHTTSVGWGYGAVSLAANGFPIIASGFYLATRSTCVPHSHDTTLWAFFLSTRRPWGGGYGAVSLAANGFPISLHRSRMIFCFTDMQIVDAENDSDHSDSYEVKLLESTEAEHEEVIVVTSSSKNMKKRSFRESEETDTETNDGEEKNGM